MNKYEVLGVVGEGAYGVVLKCRNKETGEVIAIKKFKDTEDDDLIRKNTQREVKMLRMLKHDNIVELKEAFKRKGRIYLVFEYIERNLLEVLEAKSTGLDPEYIRKVIYQLLKSTSYCHNKDIVHRDIKPENLLISSDGTLKLCDFGFARILPESNEGMTDYVATRWYRAPELLLSVQNYSKPVDLWAIACIMGELIDGQPLFPGENEIDQLFLIQKMLGPLPPDQKELFLKNPRFLGMKFPEIMKAETLERRYLGKLSKKALSFMKSLLKLDPLERLNCTQALEHSYFEGMAENNSHRALARKSSETPFNTGDNTLKNALMIQNLVPEETDKNFVDIISQKIMSNMQDENLPLDIEPGQSNKCEETLIQLNYLKEKEEIVLTEPGATSVKKKKLIKEGFKEARDFKDNEISGDKNIIPSFISNSKMLKNNYSIYNYEINEENTDADASNIGKNTRTNKFQNENCMMLGNKKSTSTEKTGFDSSAKTNAKQNDSSRSKEKYAISKKNPTSTSNSKANKANYPATKFKNENEVYLDYNNQIEEEEEDFPNSSQYINKGNQSQYTNYVLSNNNMSHFPYINAKYNNMTNENKTHNSPPRMGFKKTTTKIPTTSQNKNFIDNNLQKIHNLNVIYNANTYNYNTVGNNNNFSKKTSKKKI